MSHSAKKKRINLPIDVFRTNEGDDSKEEDEKDDKLEEMNVHMLEINDFFVSF